MYSLDARPTTYYLSQVLACLLQETAPRISLHFSVCKNNGKPLTSRTFNLLFVHSFKFFAHNISMLVNDIVVYALL